MQIMAINLNNVNVINVNDDINANNVNNVNHYNLHSSNANITFHMQSARGGITSNPATVTP
jgi:hypothetical protein